MNDINLRKTTQIGRIADACVFIYLFTLFTFNHTIVSNLGLVLLIIGTFLLCLEEKKINFSYYFFFSAIFILFNYINTKLGYSINSTLSFRLINTLLLNIFIAFVLFNYIVQRKNLEKFWSIFLLASGLFVCFLIIISGFNIFSTRFGTLVDFVILGRVVGYNANSTGDIVVASIGACIYKYKIYGKSRYLAFCLIFFTILLLTGSRRGIVQGFIVTVCMVYMLYPKKIFKNTVIIIMTAIIAYSLLMYVPVFYEIAGSRVESFFLSRQNISLADASITSRTDYIKLGWKYFLDKPWTGYGLDCFRVFHGAYGTYSHNNYIELLVSGGIPALTLYYLPIFFVLLKLLKYRSQSSGITIALALLVAQQMVEYFGITYYERMPLMVIVYSVAVIKMAEVSKKQEYKEKAKEIYEFQKDKYYYS